MALHPIRGLSLCAGAGGLDLALRIALPGYHAVCYVEREAFAASALVARMADQALGEAPIWDDLTTFDGLPWRGAVDILTAGYPCQPFSVAGKRQGADDPRHLWPHVARVISEAAPRAVFLENVPGHLSLGFDAVAKELEGLGYRVAAGLFSAAEVGASHRRERLFILADHDANGLVGQRLHQGQREDGGREAHACRSGCGMADAHNDNRRGKLKSGSSGRERAGLTRDGASVADTCGAGLAIPQRPGQSDQAECRERTTRPTAAQLRRTPLPIFAPGPDSPEWPAILDLDPTLEPSLCRVAHGMADRVDRLRLCGNGVVPLAGAIAFATLANALSDGEQIPWQYDLF